VATKGKERKRSKRSQPPLDKRFTFLGDGAPATDRKALRSILYPVLDGLSGFERNLKLWRKTGSAGERRGWRSACFARRFENLGRPAFRAEARASLDRFEIADRFSDHGQE
jgi:hypothetical protein